MQRTPTNNLLTFAVRRREAQAVHRTNINLFQNMQSTIGYKTFQMSIILISFQSPQQAVTVEQLDSASHSLPHTAATLQRHG
jgi:hypothetical protein